MCKDSIPSSKGKPTWGFWVSAFLLFVALPCYAHKINVFATVEGETIVGYAYSRGGERIRNQVVILQNSQEERLEETTTNDNGEFSFPVTQRDDYSVVMELADGHRASFTITSDEFPETLPLSTPGSERENTVEAPPDVSIASEVTGETHTSGFLPQRGISLEELERIIDTSVSRQIRPLREQLEAYETKIRLHDTLGGIGYIVGVAGIAFYIFGLRKKVE
jgi:nickel transport protein